MLYKYIKYIYMQPYLLVYLFKRENMYQLGAEAAN